MRLKLSQAAEVRLGRQRAPQFESGDHQIPYLRSANIDADGMNLRDVKSMNFTPEEQEIFALRAGDVLVTEGSGSRATVGQPAVWNAELPGPVCFQNTLLRLRPRAHVTDGHYLAWWARHAHASGQIAEVAAGANILHLGSDGLKRLELFVPPIQEQRRIADFLNDQVSRVDDIIAARRRQSALVEDQFRSRLETSLWAQAGGMPLKHLIQNITSGPRGWADLMADQGRVFVRIGNLSALGVDMRPSELARVEAPTGSPEADRASLERGDVLLSITAAMGLVAVFELDEPASFSQHVARLRPLRRSDSRWLAWTLQSKSLMDQYDQVAYGGGKIGLGLEHVRNLRVPRYGYRRRAEIAARIDSDWETFRGGREAIADSITLLTEYKQSLITAAVTGELDVTTASSRVPK